jgi:hypothetical protein
MTLEMTTTQEYQPGPNKHQGKNGMPQNPRPLEKEGADVAADATRRAAEQVRQTVETVETVAGEAERTAPTETLRHSSETIQDAWRSGTKLAQQMASRSIEWSYQAFGFTGNGSQGTVEQSSRNLSAILETGTVFAEAIQSLSREWIQFAQDRTGKNLNRFNAVFHCKTPHELMAVNAELLRDNLQDLVNNSLRVSEMTTRIAQEATRRINDASLASR